MDILLFFAASADANIIYILIIYCHFLFKGFQIHLKIFYLFKKKTCFRQIRSNLLGGLN